jgi:hypothetical protein
MNNDKYPIFIIIWDPEIITEQEYTDLVTALGDIVRASGGIGVERISSRTVTVDAEQPLFPSKPPGGPEANPC